MSEKKRNPGRRTARKLTPTEKTQMKTRSRPRPDVDWSPALDVSIPVAHAGDSHLVAETFLEKNAAGILDIVVPKDAEVESWVCFARPARGRSREWVVVTNHPDRNGRLAVPVPKTDFYVWGFGEVPSDAEDGERVWRLHGHNVGLSRGGRDVCWRLILRLAQARVPRGVKRRAPSEKARVKASGTPPKPVTIPGPDSR